MRGPECGGPGSPRGEAGAQAGRCPGRGPGPRWQMLILACSWSRSGHGELMPLGSRKIVLAVVGPVQKWRHVDNLPRNPEAADRDLG